MKQNGPKARGSTRDWSLLLIKHHLSCFCILSIESRRAKQANGSQKHDRFYRSKYELYCRSDLWDIQLLHYLQTALLHLPVKAFGRFSTIGPQCLILLIRT